MGLFSVFKKVVNVARTVATIVPSPVSGALRGLAIARKAAQLGRNIGRARGAFRQAQRFRRAIQSGGGAPVPRGFVPRRVVGRAAVGAGPRPRGAPVVAVPFSGGVRTIPARPARRSARDQIAALRARRVAQGLDPSSGRPVGARPSPSRGVRPPRTFRTRQQEAARIRAGIPAEVAGRERERVKAERVRERDQRDRARFNPPFGGAPGVGIDLRGLPGSPRISIFERGGKVAAPQTERPPGRCIGVDEKGNPVFAPKRRRRFNPANGRAQKRAIARLENGKGHAMQLLKAIGYRTISKQSSREIRNAKKASCK